MRRKVVDLARWFFTRDGSGSQQKQQYMDIWGIMYIHTYIYIYIHTYIYTYIHILLLYLLDIYSIPKMLLYLIVVMIHQWVPGYPMSCTSAGVAGFGAAKRWKNAGCLKRVVLGCAIDTLFFADCVDFDLYKCIFHGIGRGSKFQKPARPWLRSLPQLVRGAKRCSV